MQNIFNNKAKKAMSVKENWTIESLDNPICKICKKVINQYEDVPIRAWKGFEDDTYGIAFHDKCCMTEEMVSMNNL